MPEETKQTEAEFNVDEIEDCKIIIKAKGKHWSIIANQEKCSQDEAKEFRVVLLKVLLEMQSHIVVTPALEDIDPEYAKMLIEIKSPAAQRAGILQKKYEKYVSNLEWHIENNKPEGQSLEQRNIRMECYRETLADIKNIQAPKQDGELTVGDYEEVIKGHDRNVRKLDVMINGENAAKQASLIDVMGQVEDIVALCREIVSLLPKNFPVDPEFVFTQKIIKLGKLINKEA